MGFNAPVSLQRWGLIMICLLFRPLLGIESDFDGLMGLVGGGFKLPFVYGLHRSLREYWMTAFDFRAGNSRAVRLFGTQLLSIRIDLDT